MTTATRRFYDLTTGIRPRARGYQVFTTMPPRRTGFTTTTSPTSAPGLATNAGSEVAHIQAMDATGDAVHAGNAVDVSDHLNAHSTYLSHGDIDAPTRARQVLAGDATPRMDRISQAAEQQAIPVPQTQSPSPGVLSEVHARPFDALREQAAALRERYPELSDSITE